MAVIAKRSAPAASDGARVKRTEPSGQQALGETLYLMGRPPMKRFLNFAKSHAVTPPAKEKLVDAWLAARALVRRIEKDEAGLPDDPPMSRLGPEYEPLLIEFLKDPLVRHGFNTVPTDVALVELDRLVVYQKHIDVTFARQLAEKLGPAPSDEAVFRTCLAYEHTRPPVNWSRVHRGKFVFMSPSNDLRSLGPMPLQPGNVKDYPPPGDLVGVVGIGVGFGSNFMNAVYAEKRLILNNGSHRAYALRKMGVTHVPCIIQHVASRDELEVVAPSEVRRHPDLYLKHARPSMLKDYFTPELHRVFKVFRRLRQVTVRFHVEENDVPAV